MSLPRVSFSWQPDSAPRVASIHLPTFRTAANLLFSEQFLLSYLHQSKLSSRILELQWHLLPVSWYMTCSVKFYQRWSVRGAAPRRSHSCENGAARGWERGSRGLQPARRLGARCYPGGCPAFRASIHKHEWIIQQNGIGIVTISSFAQEALGDALCLQLGQN